MGRPRKEAATYGEQAKAQPGKETQRVKLVEMKRPDGHKADVHPDMVDEYRKGNYKVV